MLNSDLVMQSAADLAAEILSGSFTDQERLGRLYSSAYGRPALATEIAANTAFLAAADRSLASAETDSDKRRQRAWSILCQTILAANEFVYVQ
jgi:hypothetical protein